MLAAVLLAGAAPALAAQRDTTPRAPREEMRRRLDERFAARVREELKLTEEQSTRLRETATTFGTRRRELESRERDLRAALDDQLRPGVGADRDSVARLTNALVDLRVAYAQSFRDEHKEISTFLDPVQRARLYMMREKLMRRVHEVRGERRGFRGGDRWHGERRRHRGDHGPGGDRPPAAPRDSA
jgi:hypothetical protein